MDSHKTGSFHLTPSSQQQLQGTYPSHVLDVPVLQQTRLLKGAHIEVASYHQKLLQESSYRLHIFSKPREGVTDSKHYTSFPLQENISMLHQCSDTMHRVQKSAFDKPPTNLPLNPFFKPLCQDAYKLFPSGTGETSAKKRLAFFQQSLFIV